VGVENYRDLGRVIDGCLTPSGRGLIHTIGRHRPMAFNRWMSDRIFPGAHIPALSEMMEVFEPHDFAVLDVENIRLHYAETLRHWLARFEAVSDRVAEMFDERFVRTWRLYLAGSMAAFTTGWTQLYQVLFNRHTSNEVPWTRAYLYENEPPMNDPQINAD
jgi:cyclopropane-fatty-acyl-phospholipid synthase